MEEFVGSGLVGGLVGIFGSALNRGLGIWEAREERENLRVSNAHELAMMEEQRESRQEETEQELLRMDAQLVNDVNRITLDTSREGLAASLEHDQSIRSQDNYRWVNAVRALTRPSLTGVLGVWLGVSALMMAGDLQVTVVEALTFASVTAITWWFGDRAPRQIIGRS